MSFKVVISTASMVNTPTPLVGMGIPVLASISMPTSITVSRLVKVLLGSKSHTDIYSSFGSSTDTFLMPTKKFSDDVFATQRVNKQPEKKFFDSTELFESITVARPVVPKDRIGVANDPIAFGQMKRPDSSLSLRTDINFRQGITLAEQTASFLSEIDNLFAVKKLFDTTGTIEDLWAGQAKVKRSRTNISHLTKKYNALAFITDTPVYIPAVPGVIGGEFAYDLSSSGLNDTLVLSSTAGILVGDVLDRVSYSQGQVAYTNRLNPPIVISVDSATRITISTIINIGSGNGTATAVLIRTPQPAVPGYWAGSLDRLGDRSSVSSFIKKYVTARKTSSANMSSKTYANYAVYNKDSIEHSELIKKYITKAPRFSSTEASELVKKYVTARKVSSANTDVRIHTNYSVYNKDTIEHIELIKKYITKAPRFSSTEASELVKKYVTARKVSSANTDVRIHTNYSVYNKDTIEHIELIKKYITKAPRASSAAVSDLFKKMPKLKKFATGSAKSEVLAAGALKFTKDKVYYSQLLKKYVDIQFKQDELPLEIGTTTLTEPLPVTYQRLAGYGPYYVNDAGQTVRDPIFNKFYNKAFISNVEGIRPTYTLSTDSGNVYRPGDRIAFYNNPASTSASYIGYITQVGSNWVGFTSSNSHASGQSAQTYNDNSTQFDEFTDIKILRDPVTYYSAEVDGAWVTVSKPRHGGVNRGLARIGISANRNTINWRGIGIALGIRQPLSDNFNARTILHGVNYSTLGKSRLSLDNSLVQKKPYKKLLHAANIDNLIKKYFTKHPFDMGFEAASISYENYSVYNKLTSNIDASVVKKYVIKDIYDIAAYDLYTQYNRDAVTDPNGAIFDNGSAVGNIIYLLDRFGNPTSQPSVIGLAGVEELVKKYVIKAPYNTSASTASRSYENRVRLNKTSSSISVTRQNRAMKRFGARYELITYYDWQGNAYQVPEYKDSEQLDVTTQFDRIADYNRDFTTDSVSVDTTVSIFRQDYANSYFAEDYVGNAITS